MRNLVLFTAVVLGAAGLSAEMHFTLNTSCVRQVNLFEPVPGKTPRATTANWSPNFENFAKGPLLEDGRASEGQMFGAGGALGINTAAVGIGFTGWFDFYFTPWLAASTWVGIDYGFVGRRVHDGGSALMFNVNIGAKFVMDFADMELSDWFRPWAALYPLGFALYSATEEADPPGNDDRVDITYSDLYYMVATGGGIDFMLTNLIGVGFGMYLYGTVGGKRHEIDNVITRTRGFFGFHFEYARLNLRF